jgi:aspartate/methionine/tyrosine aminotransferase
MSSSNSSNSSNSGGGGKSLVAAQQDDDLEFLPPFELERYFQIHEFSAKYLLCSSDAESWDMSEILALADEECMKLWSNLRLSYTEARGLPALRTEIAKNYESSSITGENIMCFAGAEEGIYCVVRGMLKKGDHSIILTPCYQSLLSIAQKTCDVSVLDLNESCNWEVDLVKLQKLIIPGKTKLLIMNFPHNPTGSLISKEVQLQIVALAREFGIHVLCDEVYRGLQTSPDLLLPPIASIYERGISLGVLSKAYGMAGLRIGWIASQDVSVVEKTSDLKHYLSICNSGPSEILALISLRAKNTILQRNQTIADQNLVLIDKFLEKNNDLFMWNKPRGGCTGFMKLKPHPSINCDEFAKQLVDKFGILILPGRNFPGAENDYSSNFRFGFGRANFPTCLALFEIAVEQILRSK